MKKYLTDDVAVGIVLVNHQPGVEIVLALVLVAVLVALTPSSSLKSDVWRYQRHRRIA